MKYRGLAAGHKGITLKINQGISDFALTPDIRSLTRSRWVSFKPPESDDAVALLGRLFRSLIFHFLVRQFK